MTDPNNMIDMVVTKVVAVTPLIKELTLAAVDGGDLPTFTGGSHIIVQFGEGEQRHANAYSLMGSCRQRQHYQVAVRRDDEGRGGSRLIHEGMGVGTHVRVTPPNNLFALTAGAHKQVLIAGGIGITPFLAQIEELQAQGADFELHYAFRSAAHGAYVARLQQDLGPTKLSLYDASQGQQLSVLDTVGAQPAGSHVYVCGPLSLIDAVVEAATASGYDAACIHYEKFHAVLPTAADGAQGFTVTLAKSQKDVWVGPDESILQAIERQNIAVECLCREGYCGTCETAIVAGEAIHLDAYLSDEEKAAQATMMICVSRARSPHITLDL